MTILGTERIPQSVTKRVIFPAVLATDHETPATGKTIVITISKNGAAFANPSGGATNAVEIAFGWYYGDLTTTDTGTAGPLVVRGAVATVDDIGVALTVVDAHNAGFDGVPSAVAGATSGLAIVDSTGSVKVRTGLKKNTAQAAFSFAMALAGVLTPGLTVTAQRSIDGAGFAGCANAVTGLSAGVYLVDLAAADLNGDVITLKFTAAGADPTILTVVTVP